MCVLYNKIYKNFQLSCVLWMTDGFCVPEPEYSIQGHASATISHVAAHKAHMLQRKLTLPL